MRIDTRLAKRLNKINPSSTLAITSKAKKLKSEGKEIINLAAGEPDFDTPDFVKEAGIEAIRTGFTKYTPTTGTPELKKLICEKFKKDNGLDYAPEQIVVSCGAKHSIFNALLVIINRGEEVLIPSPYWVSYPEMVNLCEGIPRFIKTSQDNNFKITPKDLIKHISAKTKLLILNSPSNPTGCVYNSEELKNIASVCAERRILIISDEIYEKIIFDSLKHISIAGLNKEVYDLTVTVNGLSKSFSMTGWRIGYLAGPPDIVGAVSRLQDHSTSNPSSISQKAACAALSEGGDFSKTICQEFQKRRDYVVSRLKNIKKISFSVPQGAFYVFCDISKIKMDSLDFANRLLDEKFVALIPGEGFGRDDYIRISFATNLQQLALGFDRIEGWINKI
ncbi:MAG: pyridoxal phosphate-dependent aminotransferase [Candidatus Omnitrophica bacterium]|nr:pyridoxal phosphate-dependent aminotransferase [Candidatus Omnitrophota bacterium]MDD5238411.1 pyridoxal phosphate-dependent aminotransferase [Candidatus Omnitrophota bacterium]